MFFCFCFIFELAIKFIKKKKITVWIFLPLSTMFAPGHPSSFFKFPFPWQSLGSRHSQAEQPRCTATPHSTKSQKVQRRQDCFYVAGWQTRHWGWHTRHSQQPDAICFACRAYKTTFSLQTSFWKHRDLSISALRCCPGPAG